MIHTFLPGNLNLPLEMFDQPEVDTGRDRSLFESSLPNPTFVNANIQYRATDRFFLDLRKRRSSVFFNSGGDNRPSAT